MNRLGQHIRRAERDLAIAAAAFDSSGVRDGGVHQSILLLRKRAEAASYLAGLKQAWEIVSGEEWAGSSPTGGRSR